MVEDNELSTQQLVVRASRIKPVEHNYYRHQTLKKHPLSNHGKTTNAYTNNALIFHAISSSTYTLS